MREDEKLSRLIGNVYDAALDPTLWADAALVAFHHERNGLVDDETRWRMRLIVPHFRRQVVPYNISGTSVCLFLRSPSQ
jgi:hypothetical protein